MKNSPKEQGKETKTKQVEIKDVPAAVERRVVITTNGNTVKVPMCNMPLLELKASLEIVLASIAARINQLANEENASVKEAEK